MRKTLGILLILLIGSLVFFELYRYSLIEIIGDVDIKELKDVSFNQDGKSERPFIGEEAFKDTFTVVIGDVSEEEDPDDILGEETPVELPYKKGLIEMPLYRGDYYYGKHINATAATKELNQKMPILEPGSRVAVIGNGYLTMSKGWGYVSPGAEFMYASGVCWTTSALGTTMDEVNKEFMYKYDMPLFVFYAGDRYPHPVAYSTYRNSNYGFGYTVVRAYGRGSPDFKFTVNPNIKTNPKFLNLKIKIVMVSSTDHPKAFLGQSIGGYIESNIDF
ncbi:hypothetical protein JW766_04615 [Candidatus Dojkabacteria bacterium]|nr:hypothetical protein [Candidatus Dojkabacteria bacterium]